MAYTTEKHRDLNIPELKILILLTGDELAKRMIHGDKPPMIKKVLRPLLHAFVIDIKEQFANQITMKKIKGKIPHANRKPTLHPDENAR